jgi:hypothetical protein
MTLASMSQQGCSVVDRGKSVSNARVKVSICRQRRCQDFAKLGLAGLAAGCEANVSIGRTDLLPRGKSVPITFLASAVRTELLSSPAA